MKKRININPQINRGMKLTEIPIGTTVTVRHRYLVSESGYWSWEYEIITGVIRKHNSYSILIQSGTRLVFCDENKDELVN